MGCQKHFSKLQNMKNTQSKIKVNKNLEQRIVLGIKITRRILE